MRKFIITSNESGQRLDKYLKKLLPNASSGFLYKMLRKKNITLNGKKTDGGEGLREGDCVCVFFSEETFAKFSVNADALQAEYEQLKSLPMKGLTVLYEDEDILALNKPADMLSQKAKDTDISANERMLGYVIRNGQLTAEAFQTFRPSVCNRLDRNTTGILLAGKSLHGLQELSEQLRSRQIKKYYRALVTGRVEQPAHLKGYLYKDEQTNQVQLVDQMCSGAHPIETICQPLQVSDRHTLLELELVTGKSHQLRAHMASIGHPIIGDPKYGDPKVNEEYRSRYQVTHQLLHAYRVELVGKEPIIAPLPESFKRLVSNQQHGDSRIVR